MTGHARGPGLRVVICDDHRALREALGHYLLKQTGIDTVRLAADADEAVHLVRLGADVLVLDIMLAGESSSIDVLEAVRNLGLEVRVLLLSASQAPDVIAQAMALGASGFCPKDASAQLLYQSILDVSTGDVVLPDELVEPVVRLLNQRRRMHLEGAHVLERLTQREREVLRLLAAGQSRKVIARRLGMSPNTVRTHLSAIREKLGVHSQLAAAARGRQLLGLSSSDVVVPRGADFAFFRDVAAALSRSATATGAGHR